MLFKNLMKICLVILGVLLIIEGLNEIFHLFDLIIIPFLFCFVVVFVLGVGFSRYCVEDGVGED